MLLVWLIAVRSHRASAHNIVLVDMVHGAPRAVATFVGGRIRN